MGKLAIVIPWFGKDLKGGAEQHAWEVATRLSSKGHEIHVLTTCCESFQSDWDINHLPQGITKEAQLFIHRFPVNPRNQPKFDRINSHLLQLEKSYCSIGARPLSPVDEKIFSRDLIYSRALLDYIDKEKENYESFLFLPYLYSTTIEGIPIVKDKAVLLPCLHDEAYAYLSNISNCFYIAQKILFISEGERKIAEKIYGPCISNRSFVVGAGVEAHAVDDIELPLDLKSNEYYLYLGRKSAEKNVPQIIQAFKQFKILNPESKKMLILCGHGDDFNDTEQQIVDLGLVNEAQKQTLIKNCRVLLQPSGNESFSRVIYEAWLAKRPVAVNSNCQAMQIPVDESGAGWAVKDQAGWLELFKNLESSCCHEEILDKGLKGYEYSHSKVSWDCVIQEYEKHLFNSSENKLPRLKVTPFSIHQVLPNLAFGDAISNFALYIRDYLRTLGYHSEIYVQFTDPIVEHECSLYEDNQIQNNDIILYHHSIGCGILKDIIAHKGPKALIYHNITPAEFFFNFDLDFYNILKKGRAQLPLLAPFFPISVGDSQYNVNELKQAGYSNPEVLGIGVTPDKWTLNANQKIYNKHKDRGTNIIYVSRISPNKCQHDLIQAFVYYKVLDPEGKLFLVGDYNPGNSYCQYIQTLISNSDCSDSIFLTGKVSEEDLFTYYRIADLFWSMSEHEGFGVPLLEAMWFDVPVLSYKSSAVPETMGRGGVLFNEKSDFKKLAALAHELSQNSDLRNYILAKQKTHRVNFLPSNMNPRIDKLIEKLARQ